MNTSLFNSTISQFDEVTSFEQEFDMKIEQTVMQSMKCSEGLAHEWKISDGILNKWFLGVTTTFHIGTTLKEACALTLSSG